MPPISASRSAPLISCSSPAARNASIQVRKSCRNFAAVVFGARFAPRMSATLMATRSEEHTSELQSHSDLVCRLLLEKKKNAKTTSAYQACSQPTTHIYVISAHALNDTV